MHDAYFKHDDSGIGLEEDEYEACGDPNCDWCKPQVEDEW